MILFLLAWGWLIVLIAEAILYPVLLKNKLGVPAVISMVVSLGILQWLGVPIGQTVWAHPLWAFGGFLGWTVAGFLWLYVKWGRMAQVMSKRVDKKKDRFLRSKGRALENGQLPADLKAEFSVWFSMDRYDDDGMVELQLEVKNNKSEIFGIVAGWPLSIAETFLCDFVINLWENILDLCTKSLNAWSARFFARHKADLPTKEELEVYQKAKLAKEEAERLAREEVWNKNKKG